MSLSLHDRHSIPFETSPVRGLGEVSIASLRPPSLANPPIARNGTALAISYSTLGVAALSPVSTGRGGARNVPADLVRLVTRLQRGWLRRITGQPYRGRVIHSKPIGGRLGLESRAPDLHAINLDAALTYLLKGASPQAASQFGLERLEPGGLVIGKRCGTSQNIGRAARTRDLAMRATAQGRACAS